MPACRGEHEHKRPVTSRPPLRCGGLLSSSSEVEAASSLVVGWGGRTCLQESQGLRGGEKEGEDFQPVASSSPQARPHEAGLWIKKERAL